MFRLCYLSLIFCLLGTTLAVTREQALEECMKEFSISPDTVSYFRKNGELPNETSHSDKCGFFCVPKKMEATDETAFIDKERGKTMMKKKYPQLDDNKIAAVVDKCTQRSETDPCDKWYQLAKCYKKEVGGIIYS